MTLPEIKQAIGEGKKVYYQNLAYPVVKDSEGQYLIKCTLTNYCILLTWRDGITLNGKETNFFIYTGESAK